MKVSLTLGIFNKNNDYLKFIKNIIIIMVIKTLIIVITIVIL